MNFEFLGRIFAWLAAINGIVTAAILALTPLADGNPYVAKVLVVLALVTNIITPFLPRAQGKLDQVTKR
jgi:hypothetical protein